MPDNWKISTITPIFKAGDPCSVCDFSSHFGGSDSRENYEVLESLAPLLNWFSDYLTNRSQYVASLPTLGMSPLAYLMGLSRVYYKNTFNIYCIIRFIIIIMNPTLCTGTLSKTITALQYQRNFIRQTSRTSISLASDCSRAVAFAPSLTSSSKPKPYMHTPVVVYHCGLLES